MNKKICSALLMILGVSAFIFESYTAYESTQVEQKIYKAKKVPNLRQLEKGQELKLQKMRGKRSVKQNKPLPNLKSKLIGCRAQELLYF